MFHNFLKFASSCHTSAHTDQAGSLSFDVPRSCVDITFRIHLLTLGNQGPSAGNNLAEHMANTEETAARQIIRRRAPGVRFCMGTLCN